MSKGLAAIKEAVADKIVDDFETGDVLRWKKRGKYNFAALKAGDGKWYTTSKTQEFAPRNLDFGELVLLLAEPDITEIEYATGWDSVSS